MAAAQDPGMVQNASASLLSAARRAQIERYCLSNRLLELIVFTTEQCNFRCTYCYEDFAIGRMSDDTSTAICRLIDRRAAGLDGLHVSYFGGEPLLNLKAIRAISAHAGALSMERGFRFTAAATTNGYMLDPMLLAELVGLGCDTFQISLDGWGEDHDRTRRQRNGSGSFDRIWKNLVAARATSLAFNMTLRVHVMPGNAGSLMTLVDAINRELDDDRFVVHFKLVGQWGGTHVDHPEVYRPGADDLAELYSRLLARSHRSRDLGLDEVGGGSGGVPEQHVGAEGAIGGDMPYICYASRANSFAIRANGRVNKCTVALNSPNNDVGYIDPSGDIVIDSARLLPWLGGLTTLDPDHLGCPAAHMTLERLATEVG